MRRECDTGNQNTCTLSAGFDPTTRAKCQRMGGTGFRTRERVRRRETEGRTHTTKKKSSSHMAKSYGSCRPVPQTTPVTLCLPVIGLLPSGARAGVRMPPGAGTLGAQMGQSSGWSRLAFELVPASFSGASPWSVSCQRPDQPRAAT